MKVILETERLTLRELKLSDKDNLYKILSDEETMKYYPSPFSEDKVENWIKWNIENYNKYGHGLWAVILKDNNQFIGDCGITMQEIDGEILAEVGYHINKAYWNKGYASEASKAVIEYAFNNLNYNELYTYTDTKNIPSIKVAQKNGMNFIKYFNKEIMNKTIKEVLYKIKIR